MTGQSKAPRHPTNHPDHNVNDDLCGKDGEREREWCLSRLEAMRLIARAMASEFAQRPGVLGVWLIGSVARGNIWEGSDIDLQVMVSKISRRIEYRQINDQTIITKFFTKKEIGKSVLEDEDDPVICAIRDSTILYDPSGFAARLKQHTEQASQLRKRSLVEMIERLEETWEAWQGARKAKEKKDQPALALAVSCITRSLMGLLYALEGIRAPNYTPTEENLARLPLPERQGLRDCLGTTRLDLEARFRKLTDMLNEATQRIAQIYGEEIVRILKGKEMTYRDIEEELGAGIPRQLAEILKEKALISVTKKPVTMSGTTFYEEVYSTPKKP